MQRAASDCKDTVHPSSDDIEMAECAVSLDGTWQRRGHASYHGVATTVLVDSGKRVDVETLSNICQGCTYWEKKDKSSAE